MPLAKGVLDAARIGGATLRDHAHNVVQRATQLADRAEDLSYTIEHGLFGPAPRENKDDAPKMNLSDNVSADLTDIDRALTVLSNAIMRLEEIAQKMGLGQGGVPEPAEPPRSWEATRDTTTPTRQRGERYG